MGCADEKYVCGSGGGGGDELGRHPDRGLAVVGRIEDALPSELGGDPLDADLTLGLDRLLGEVHI